MPTHIKERIAKLRKEIEQIGAANREYLQGGNKILGAPDHERRFQRLLEIRDELKSLTDWKKT
jgi:hypothetical protein